MGEVWVKLNSISSTMLFSPTVRLIGVSAVSGGLAPMKWYFVEALQLVMADAARHGGYVVDVGHFDHRRHSGIDVTRFEFVAAMRFPQCHQIMLRHSGPPCFPMDRGNHSRAGQARGHRHSRFEV